MLMESDRINAQLTTQIDQLDSYPNFSLYHYAVRRCGTLEISFFRILEVQPDLEYHNQEEPTERSHFRSKFPSEKFENRQ